MTDFKWQEKITEDIFFITPDVKRGIGLEDVLPRYHIVCSYNDPLIPVLRRQGASIFCLEEINSQNMEIPNNSGRILENGNVLEYIRKKAKGIPHIMYFKPSIKLDMIIEKNKFRAIGNKSDLNDSFENKILFHEISRSLFPQNTVKSEIGVLGNFKFNELSKIFGFPLVIQFAHGWAGKTTFFIKTETEFLSLLKNFHNTKVKISKFVSGLTVLNNCCVYGNTVLISEPAIQLNDIPQFRQKPGVTCGRQWPVRFIDREQISIIRKLSTTMGEYMRNTGFRGFFGMDFLVDKASGKVYISEANARMTASSSFYTYLERKIESIPLLFYHILAFLNGKMPEVSDQFRSVTGSQVIFRSADLEFSPKIDRDYGIYEIKGGNVNRKGTDYYPQKLAPDEFIFIKRTRKKESGEEQSRLETTMEVLDKPGIIKKWLRDLIFNGHGQDRKS